MIQLNMRFFFLKPTVCFSSIFLRVSSCVFFCSSLFWVVSSFSLAASSRLRLISSSLSRFRCFSSSRSWLKPSGSYWTTTLATFTISSSFCLGSTFFSSSSSSDSVSGFFAGTFFPATGATALLLGSGCFLPLTALDFYSASSESDPSSCLAVLWFFPSPYSFSSSASSLSCSSSSSLAGFFTSSTDFSSFLDFPFDYCSSSLLELSDESSYCSFFKSATEMPWRAASSSRSSILFPNVRSLCFFSFSFFAFGFFPILFKYINTK